MQTLIPQLLKDKVALITGAGSGIGRAISLLFAQCGAFSFVLDRSATSAREVATEVEQNGGRAFPLVADITSDDTLRKAFEQINKVASRLDILVNNAGTDFCETALSADEDTWDRCLDVNLKGAWLCCKYSLPLMIQSNGGVIVNIASTHAVRGHKNDFPYGVAKGGILSLTLSVAADFGHYGIRVNAICPGLVFTPMTKSYFTSHNTLTEDEFVARQPLAVKICPEDIGNAALFLASDMARCITGIALFVDGGRTTAGCVPV